MFTLFAIGEATLGLDAQASFGQAMDGAAAVALEHATLTGTYGG